MDRTDCLGFCFKDEHFFFLPGIEMMEFAKAEDEERAEPQTAFLTPISTSSRESQIVFWKGGKSRAGGERERKSANQKHVRTSLYWELHV